MLQWHSAAPFDLPFLITATEERRAGDGGREEEGWSTPGTLRVELETRGPVSLSAAPLLSSYCFFSYLFSPLLPPWPGVCVSGWNGGLCLSAASLLLTRDRQRHLSTNTHTHNHPSLGLVMDNTLSGVHHHTHRYSALTFAVRSQQSALASLALGCKTTSVTDDQWTLLHVFSSPNHKQTSSKAERSH